MNVSNQNMHAPAIFFVCIFFLSACAGLPHKISEESKEFRSSPPAEAIISALKSQNHKLNTIKGLGRIAFLENAEKDITFRIAWVASSPDKIRITLSSISGHPVISTASDGRWFYFYSHVKGDYFKKRPTNFNVKRFFRIPIKSGDIVNILLGRIPMAKFHSAELKEVKAAKDRSNKNPESKSISSLNEDNERTTNGWILLLKSKWRNVREKIYLDDLLEVQKVEMFDSAGEIVYRIELIKMQTIKSYRVPYRLKVSNNDGAGFQLNLDRYWADATVSPSVFKLMPPKKS
jgi:starvation-inducible outer membrane lipoprotein